MLTFNINFLYLLQTYEPLDGETGKIPKAIKTTFEEIAFQNLMYRVSQIKRHPGLLYNNLFRLGKREM